jgi:hypothetical protein
MKLTGYINDDMVYVYSLFGIEVDVKTNPFFHDYHRHFGAIMDVSITICLSLNELQQNDNESVPGALMHSGFRSNET